jgi:hypothetical protein
MIGHRIYWKRSLQISKEDNMDKIKSGPYDNAFSINWVATIIDKVRVAGTFN